MTRNRFLMAMGEYLSLLDYPLTAVLTSKRVINLDDEALNGIITAFRAAMSCEGDFPESPIFVPGGKVSFTIDADDKTIVLTLDASPSYNF